MSTYLPVWVGVPRTTSDFCKEQFDVFAWNNLYGMLEFFQFFLSLMYGSIAGIAYLFLTRKTWYACLIDTVYTVYSFVMIMIYLMCGGTYFWITL